MPTGIPVWQESVLPDRKIAVGEESMAGGVRNEQPTASRGYSEFRIQQTGKICDPPDWRDLFRIMDSGFLE